MKRTSLILGLFTLFVITALANLRVNALTPALTPEVVIAQRGNLNSDEEQITKAIMLANQPISPQAPVRVKKIAIAGSFALASVLIGEEGGGMAALGKKRNDWRVLGGGGGWLVLQDLENLGIPRRSAQVLLGRIDPNWKNYEPE